MKSKFVVISTLLVSMSALAAQSKKQLTAPVPVKSPSQSIVQINNPDLNQKYNSAPVSLNIIKSGFDVNFRPLFLAPVKGTEMSLSMTQSQFNAEVEFSDGYSSSTKLDSSIGILGISHAFENSLFIDAHIGFLKSTSNYENNGEGSSNPQSVTSGDFDPSVTIGGRINTDAVKLILALTGKLSTGYQETKYASDGTGESNAKMGGGSLTPSLTLYSQVNAIQMGTLLAYTFSQEKGSKTTNRSGIASTDYETDGNIQNLSLFIEIPSAIAVFGGSIDYTKIESRKYRSDDGSTGKLSPFSYSTVTAFASFNLSQNFKLVPSLSYGQFGEGIGQLKRKDIVSAGVNGQFNF